jgi:hypothetical protein
MGFQSQSILKGKKRREGGTQKRSKPQGEATAKCERLLNAGTLESKKAVLRTVFENVAQTLSHSPSTHGQREFCGAKAAAHDESSLSVLAGLNRSGSMINTETR